MTFLHWLNSPEHLERTAVVYGDSKSGKTAVLNGTARTLAMRYQESQLYYLCAGTVDGMRAAHRKGLLKKGVPRIIEDYAPKGNPNGHRQSLQEYLVNLLNVKDGARHHRHAGWIHDEPARDRATAHLHQSPLRSLDQEI